MAGSILIFGGNQKQREKRVEELLHSIFTKDYDAFQFKKNPDIRFIDLAEEKKSIGIGEVRGLIEYLNEKPFHEKMKVVVITQADKLTKDAQNSLLKVLEEPPEYATIILCAQTQNDLLETVISRCKKINLKELKEETTVYFKYSLEKVLEMNYGERLDWAGEVSKEEKEIVCEILEHFIIEARELMIENPTKTGITNVITTLVKSKTDLENTNLNIKLALEALVLNITSK